MRPSAYFGSTARSENTAGCKKNYRKSDHHSQGIFTVQCCCRYPKLLGISVMSECEEVGTAFSVLLSRFKKLPRVCYYDNACNMLRSNSIRAPWVNESCLVACGRFHYKGHTCNSVYNPDSYTSGAKSLNHTWNFSKSHVRYLNGDNMMVYSACRAVFINLRIIVRQSVRQCDTENINVREFTSEMWDCDSLRCVSLSSG